MHMSNHYFILLQSKKRENILLVEDEIIRRAPVAAEPFKDDTNKGVFVRKFLCLLESCREQWREKGAEEIPWSLLEELSNHLAAGGMAFIQIGDPMFENKENASALIEKYCLRTKQYMPKSRGEILRVIYESLVLEIKTLLTEQYREYLEEPCVLYTMGLDEINGQLCQWISDALGLTVKAISSDAAAAEKIFTPNIEHCWEVYEKKFQLLKRILQKAEGRKSHDKGMCIAM